MIKQLVVMLFMTGFLINGYANPLSSQIIKQPAEQQSHTNFAENYVIPSQLQFTTNKKAHWEQGSFNALIPLKNTPTLDQFTQIGLQRKNHEWTWDLGVGMRYFFPHTMLGGNIFFNKNHSTGQSNLSIGIEYARNYFKFNVNDYLRLSNSWQNSSNLPGYQQQPATGYDINLQGWLPFFPQLGVVFRYERYYGGLIALMGHSNDSNALYSDASTTLVGINYTPIPLITLSTNFRASEDHQHDTQIALNLHYVFGEALSSQLNPDSVRQLHTLHGLGHSLVMRNNGLESRVIQIT